MKRWLMVLGVASLLNGCAPSLFPVEMPVTASLLPGQPLVVRLPSNPSTGYGWTYTVVGDDVLRLDSVSGVGSEPNGMVGAPGETVWSFRARDKGIAQLNFVYARSWEKNVTPAKTFRLTVVVQTAP